MTDGAPGGPEIVTRTGHRIRAVETEDLAVCAAIWREALNDYLGRLAQPEIPDDLVAILRLYDHLRATDPTTFLVAEAPPVASAGESVGSPDRLPAWAGASPPPIDGFVVVVRRDGLWFLSMLFVRPRAQAQGLGRALLAAAGAEADPSAEAALGADAVPGAGGATGSGRRASAPLDRSVPIGFRATATDTAQPISNGLYASLGIVPRVPLLRLVGLPTRRGAFERLPAGVETIAFDEVGDAGDGLGPSALASELESLDRDAAGFGRRPDHAFAVREGRVGFLFRDRDGRAVGYGYTSEAGRVGPIAVREASLLGPVVGHLVRAVRPRGAFGIWVAGSAGEALVPLLRAGFRLDGFPVLLCWDRPFADFGRYIPMSPGLL